MLFEELPVELVELVELVAFPEGDADGLADGDGSGEGFGEGVGIDVVPSPVYSKILTLPPGERNASLKPGSFSKKNNCVYADLNTVLLMFA